MENCLQCNKPLQHVLGRKQKSFCDVNCRNKYFYAQRKKQLEKAKALLVSLPSDYIDVKKIGILTQGGEVKPLTLSKPLRTEMKPGNPKKPQSHADHVEPAKESYDAPKADVVFKSSKEYDRLIPITNKTDDLKILLTEILASPLLDKDKKSFESRINFKINWNKGS